MSSVTTESSPLLPPAADNRPKGTRSVTFNPNPVTRTIEAHSDDYALRPSTSPVAAVAGPSGTTSSSLPGGPQAPMLSAFNSKLRRRHSAGGPAAVLPGASAIKIGPQRSTKNAQKLKLLPNPDFGEEGPDEESGRDVYSQYTRIKDPTARRDAARLGKADRTRLPRVTAYCTANKYDMDGLMRFLKGPKGKAKGTNPKLIDECIYTPYNYNSKQVEMGSGLQQPQTVHSSPVHANPVHSNPVHPYERRHSTGEYATATATEAGYPLTQDLIDLRQESQEREEAYASQPDTFAAERGDENAIFDTADFDIEVHTPEVFLFDYGVVVIWGMTLQQEQRFLKEMAKFELEKLSQDDVEVEMFNFYYTREYQARIYNDFIALRDKNNYKVKLAIAHALAQSTKTSLFEELMDSTIDACKDVPTEIALTGKIALTRKQIHMQIGELFILKLNIHLGGSILDTPELFWVEPQLEPVYQAVRKYLEMDQRVKVLTDRMDVVGDLLAVLKDQLSHGHGEKLEWIVIVLIAAEILVAGINILVDMYWVD
ncbi:Sad1-interacting factor 2 [Cytospora mali]|uniref:Sad1-interacting factor 2 n=1 Tax=Cytospora mali TaxID=578113 RepID=A0A194V7A7_CYTMA|nr:Sad1-interacting factor 2 [Valsa mali var. pyri (nom. inval.)]